MLLKTGFILLMIMLAIAIFAGACYAADQVFDARKKSNAFKIKTALLLICWISYVSILSAKGILIDASWPPRIPVLVVFPFILFISWFYRSDRFRDIIDAVPLHWTIYFQTFRIMVEVLLFGLFMEHMLPWVVTFEGCNFDIGIGITAPFIGYFAARGRLYRRTIRIWNMLGIFTLGTVVLVLNELAYHPTFLGQQETILGKGFGTFPYTYMAGFYLPLAMFVHIFALVKTSKSYQSSFVRK